MKPRSFNVNPKSNENDSSILIEILVELPFTIPDSTLFVISPTPASKDIFSAKFLVTIALKADKSFN